MGPEVILVRGAPGIGKTTAGGFLRATGRARAVIDIDSVRGMIHGERFLFGQDDEYLMAVRASAYLSLDLVRRCRAPVCVMDVFSAPVLLAFLEVVAPVCEVLVVSLVADDDELCARMSGRGAGYVDLPVARLVNRHTIETAALADLVIDTNGMAPESVAAAIGALLPPGTRTGRGYPFAEERLEFSGRGVNEGPIGDGSDNSDKS